ncbi:MAG TPA: adenine phosphoribosyltransferase [Pseudonocardia sp.]
MTDRPGADPALVRAAGLIRDVPDYPHDGVLFRDITPLLADADAFAHVARSMAAPAAGADLVVGVEARGFLLGAAVALAAGAGVVPVRKAGKLPRVAAGRDYQLEYGTATLQLPEGGIAAGAGVYVVDDVLATGGTLAASCDLVEQVGGRVVGVGVLLELPALAGRERLPGRELHALLRG